MSLRPDLLPEELLRELEKLQDDVPAVDADEIELAVEQSLGRPIQEVFSHFDLNPVAAASLSQVHRGVLRGSGEQVAIKVQRPDIGKTIRYDLDILESICHFLDQQFTDLAPYELPELVKTVRRTLIRELDFSLERDHMDIARSYARDARIQIPQTFSGLCSERLLVMTYFDGMKFKEILGAPKADREMVAKTGLHSAVKQILEDGYFHADPHPGNILIGKDLGICFIDWGMVGRLTERDRYMLSELLAAIVERDIEGLVRSFLRICGNTGKSLDKDSLQRELLGLLDRYHAVPLKQINIGHFLMSLMKLLRDFELRLPIEYTIMIKALVTAEGSARLADPDLNIIQEVKGQVLAIAKKRYSPEVVWKNVRNLMADLWMAQETLPRQIQSIVGALERGEFSVVFRLKKLEQLVDTLENASNRLTIGIITGAIIMGSSMIITTGVRPFLFGYPALGVIGYLISVILGLWLIVTILRNRKY